MLWSLAVMSTEGRHLTNASPHRRFFRISRCHVDRRETPNKRFPHRRFFQISRFHVDRRETPNKRFPHRRFSESLAVMSTEGRHLTTLPHTAVFSESLAVMSTEGRHLTTLPHTAVFSKSLAVMSTEGRHLTNASPHSISNAVRNPAKL